MSAGGWRRGGDLTLRIVAAVPLGYAVGSAWTMALARLLPGDRAEATVWAALVSFALCAAAAIWALAARSGWRAFWTLLVAGGAGGAIAWFSIATAGRI